MQLFTQGRVVGVLHGGKVGGHLKRDAPALFKARGLRVLAVHRDDVFGDAFEFGFALNIERKGVGCVQKVFAELLAQSRVFLAEFL